MAAIRPNRTDDRGEREEDAYRKVPNRTNEMPNRAAAEASNRMNEIPNRTNEIPDRLSQASKENPKAKDYLTKDEVNRQVLQDNICRYLGRDAYCVPDVHEKTKELWGYWIIAPRPFTTAMLDDLKNASRAFEKERNAHHKRTDGETLSYEKSQTYERSNMAVEYGDNRKPYAGRVSPSFGAASGVVYGVPPPPPPQSAYPPTSGSYVISGPSAPSPMQSDPRYPAPEYKTYPQPSRNEPRDPRDPRNNMAYADNARHAPAYNDQHMTGGYGAEPPYARPVDPRDGRPSQPEYYGAPGNGDRVDPRDMRPGQQEYYGSNGKIDTRMDTNYYPANGAQYSAQPMPRDPRDPREGRLPEGRMQDGYYSNSGMEGLSGPGYGVAPGRNAMSPPQYESVGRQEQHYQSRPIDRGGYRS